MRLASLRSALEALHRLNDYNELRREAYEGTLFDRYFKGPYGTKEALPRGAKGLHFLAPPSGRTSSLFPTSSKDFEK